MQQDLNPEPLSCKRTLNILARLASRCGCESCCSHLEIVISGKCQGKRWQSCKLAKHVKQLKRIPLSVCENSGQFFKLLLNSLRNVRFLWSFVEDSIIWKWCKKSSLKHVNSIIPFLLCPLHLSCFLLCPLHFW